MAVQKTQQPELESPGGGCGSIPRLQAYQTNEIAIKVGRCTRCGRPLRDPVSMQRGMGPVCAVKARADQAMREAETRVVVTVNGHPLRHAVRHSPTGFEWGYGGSGPADLARSILLDYLDGHPQAEAVADALYQRFKWDFVARFEHDGWRLPGSMIAGFLAYHGVQAPVRDDVVYEGRRFA